MKRMIFTVTLLILLIGATPLMAGDESGGYAGSFLNFGAGARAVALGQANSAYVNDATAPLFNPAGLAHSEGAKIIATHALVFQDRSVNYFGGSYAFKPVTIGVGWLRFGVSDMDVWTDLGEQTGETFDDAENAFMLAVGRTVVSTPKYSLSVGLGMKYLRHTLWDNKADGLGFDIGAISTIHMTSALRHINFAAVIQNVGATMTWDTESGHEDEVPISMRFGVAMAAAKFPVDLMCDIEKVENQGARLHLGTQYTWQTMAFRAGLNDDKLTAGAGFSFDLSRYDLVVDYAYAGDNISTDGTHYFSFRMAF
ncbi:MAG: PorV/PorQ family protein [candidate division Zixibacteria bacterium]|nr:PorV/PorQ family protein [candidate division Zixibacteria bacterium]